MDKQELNTGENFNTKIDRIKSTIKYIQQDIDTIKNDCYNDDSNYISNVNYMNQVNYADQIPVKMKDINNIYSGQGQGLYQNNVPYYNSTGGGTGSNYFIKSDRDYKKAHSPYMSKPSNNNFSENYSRTHRQPRPRNKSEVPKRNLNNTTEDEYDGGNEFVSNPYENNLYYEQINEANNKISSKHNSNNRFFSKSPMEDEVEKLKEKINRLEMKNKELKNHITQNTISTTYFGGEEKSTVNNYQEIILDTKTMERHVQILAELQKLLKTNSFEEIIPTIKAKEFRLKDDFINKVDDLYKKISQIEDSKKSEIKELWTWVKSLVRFHETYNGGENAYHQICIKIIKENGLSGIKELKLFLEKAISSLHSSKRKVDRIKELLFKEPNLNEGATSRYSKLQKKN